MNVNYCTNSTLREVWAAVIGLPDVVTPDEFGAIRARITREWPVHEFVSREVLLPPEPPPSLLGPEAAIPPVWWGQVRWEERRWLGRWGHRVAGLHRVLASGERYRTFASTMRPMLEQWLLVAREAYTFLGIDPPVGTVVFGYVNAFDLPSDGGDLSEWFRFNFAIEAAGSGVGLSEFEVAARIPRPDLRARASLHLRAREDEATTRVTVRTIVERDVQEGARFGNGELLLGEIGEAKILAKDTFFSFVTDRTLELMGATDAEPEA